MNGADLLVRSLKSHGVSFVPTLSGNGLNPFYEACRQARAWQNAGMHLRMAVNLSARQFRQDGLIETVRGLGVPCEVDHPGLPRVALDPAEHRAREPAAADHLLAESVDQLGRALQPAQAAEAFLDVGMSLHPQR